MTTAYCTIKEWQQEIDTLLENHANALCEESTLKEATAYVLTNGGKRLRPLLVLLVARALNNECNVSAACKSVEFFHTASLIADDLPCMDNDAERRGITSVHVKYKESTALLSSYGLIVEAFRMIHEAATSMEVSFEEKAKVLFIALEEASKLAGFEGCVLGQYYDIEGGLGHALEKLTYLKTGTLFEVSFLFGWLFGGGAIAKLDQVKVAARHFGIAFQIRDDILDSNEDEKAPNTAKEFGIDGARMMYQKEIQAFQESLKALSICSLPLQALVKRLNQAVIA